jgi:hypothetical protein
MITRTTVRLPSELLAAAQRHARDTGRTLTALIEDALRLALTTEGRRPGPRPDPLPTFGTGGLLPGVDLDDGAGLAERVRERDATT